MVVGVKAQSGQERGACAQPAQGVASKGGNVQPVHEVVEEDAGAGAQPGQGGGLGVLVDTEAGAQPGQGAAWGC